MMLLKITYIDHSGFLIEWDTCYWLFDYYKGEIPEMASEKKLFVFVSHKHEDHFNPEIFKLYDRHKEVEYILSSDIRVTKETLAKYGYSEEILNKTVSVKPTNEYELWDLKQNKIRLKTLKSTDCGVAFLLQYQGKTIYHAGDLNLWVWKEESKQYNNNMTANFLKEMDALKDITIDIAFAPLDPRQEDWYYLGLEKLINTAQVKFLFPMHFWDKPDIIKKYKSERNSYVNNARIMEISQNSQKWEMVI
jgi:L-ascorbate metabolism protein UlaG (beta-lactamase superfamily)